MRNNSESIELGDSGLMLENGSLVGQDKEEIGTKCKFCGTLRHKMLTTCPACLAKDTKTDEETV